MILIELYFFFFTYQMLNKSKSRQIFLVAYLFISIVFISITVIWFQLFQICGNERCQKCIAYDATIVVKPGNCFGFPHFVHVMEYCYFFTDILLHNKHRNVIVKRPLRKYHSPYVDSFLETLSRVTNFKFCDDIHLESQNDVCEYIFNHEENTISDNFIINNTFKNGIYVEWFMNDTTHIMRDLFLPDISPTKINIGLK